MPRQRGLAIGALVFLILLIPLWAAFDAPGMAMDEGMVLLYPELVMQGKLPYRDFETFYAPGNLWVLAGVYSVFGVHVDVERSVGLIYRLLLLGGLFVLLRRWGLIAAVGGLAIAVVFFVPSRLLAFAWFGGVACLLWSVVILAGRSTRWRAPLAGLLAAGALLYRQDLAPAVLASALPLLFGMTSRERWQYVGAFGIGLVPMGVLALAAGIQVTIENLFTYPVMISNPGRRLPLSFAPGPVQAMFYLHVGACIAVMAAALVTLHRNRTSADGRLLLSIAFLALGMTHQALQRADTVHIVFAAFFSVALLPTALLILLRSCFELKHPAWEWGISGAVLATILASAPLLGTMLVSVTKHTLGIAPMATDVVVRDRRFPYRSIALQTQEVVTFLEEHSKPGERLFVGTADLRRTFAGDTFIYHLLPWLPPATYFLELNPLSANRPDSRLAADVASADWLVLNRAWDHSLEPNLSVQNGPDSPNEVVRTQFDLCRVAQPYLVFRRKP